MYMNSIYKNIHRVSVCEMYPLDVAVPCSKSQNITHSTFNKGYWAIENIFYSDILFLND